MKIVANRVLVERFEFERVCFDLEIRVREYKAWYSIPFFRCLYMCLSFPGKITDIRDGYALVDYGEYGARENVNISLVDAKVGSYVLVQGGFAIRVLSSEESKETLETWKMIRELQEPSEELGD